MCWLNLPEMIENKKIIFEFYAYFLEKNIKNHKDSFLKNKDENNIKFKTIFLKEKTISGIHLKSISG